MAPTVGLPVTYMAPEGNFAVSAAVITRVIDAKKGIVNVKVFHDQGPITDREDVGYGTQQGQWMEILDDKDKPRF